MTLFVNTSSPDYAPIEGGETNRVRLLVTGGPGGCMQAFVRTRSACACALGKWGRAMQEGHLPLAPASPHVHTACASNLSSV